SGFTTVAYTEGMPPTLILACESLSAYRHVFHPGDRQEAKNPVLFSHAVVAGLGKEFSVISRVSACGADYSGRTNKLAHHMVLSPEHRVSQGPARLMMRSDLLRKEWTRAPAILPFSPWFWSERDPENCHAAAWEKRTGWAGWAGVLAGSYYKQPRRPVYLLFEPGMDLLPLIAESLDLLPPAERWKVTFSTYFTAAPQSSECLWRCCLSTPDFLARICRQPDTLILDLASPLDPPSNMDSVWIQSAVSGVRFEERAPALSSVEAQPPMLPPADLPHATALQQVASGPGELGSPPPVKPPGRKPLPAWFYLSLSILALLAMWWFMNTPSGAPRTEPPATAVVIPAEPTPEATPSAPQDSADGIGDVPEVKSASEVPSLSEPAEEALLAIPAPVTIPEELPGAQYDMVIPSIHRDNANTMTLLGLPSGISTAQRFAFFLAPGFRILRTNGTLSAAGISGALAGRGSGEMSLTVSHPEKGLDDINLRLRPDGLHCSARSEWLACLLAIQVEDDASTPLVIWCAPPLVIRTGDLRFAPDAEDFILEMGERTGAELIRVILQAGLRDDWSAKLNVAGNREMTLSVTPDLEKGVFRLRLRKEDQEWIRMMRQVREHLALREKPLPVTEPAATEASPVPVEADWSRLSDLLSDWFAMGWQPEELLAPLQALSRAGAPPRSAPMPRSPGEGDAEAWLTWCKLLTSEAPAEAAQSTIVKVCLAGDRLLAEAVKPLDDMEKGQGLRMELHYDGRLLMAADER
ncbi:MAG: hypothetical protein V2A34_14720, partial [Lentisphaerota bacterium]